METSLVFVVLQYVLSLVVSECCVYCRDLSKKMSCRSGVAREKKKKKRNGKSVVNLKEMGAELS